MLQIAIKVKNIILPQGSQMGTVFVPIWEPCVVGWIQSDNKLKIARRNEKDTAPMQANEGSGR